jgi:hypothetical protein
VVVTPSPTNSTGPLIVSTEMKAPKANQATPAKNTQTQAAAMDT